MHGLRVRDRTTGLVTVEITNRLTRTIGVINTGSSAGSISVPDFALGAGWACVLESPEPNPNLSFTWSYPIVSISGTTLSWSFLGLGGSTIVPCDVIYGVY